MGNFISRTKLVGYAVFSLFLCVGLPVGAGTGGGIYNMSNMLAEKHPFADTIRNKRLLFERPVASPVIPTTIITGSSKPKTGKSPRLLPRYKMITPKYQKSSVSPDNLRKSRLISELRGGLFVHDEGPFSRNKESGFDANIEILFSAPKVFKAVWSPRPHIGGIINSEGNTSQGYAGATWDWSFFNDYFFNFSLGGVIHTGEKETSDLNKKSLGCTFLFRESLDLGYQISGPHSIMFHLGHISNAKLCSKNEGLETFGLRYGYRF